MRGDVRFAGYAAVFDRVDRGGDVVRAGAFGPIDAAGVPLLWQHGPGSVIGRIETAREDKRGLRVIGRVSRRTAAGREAAAALATGALDGLSFGYRVKAARGAGPRELLGLELVEVSLVTHPMQPLARVIGVEDQTLSHSRPAGSGSAL
ncbi:HK97 family phage prohead protease [Sphingobium sp. CR2-8]|uniref:HK97 family phage prohead protease n=1 Tax=Sphingobium sp. CR2-8 TaxID=1306534 RepID=UPI002DB92FB9|nr:HK97 family phage prohead protease [Sphingobium sp. CR2-8]MEC3911638.1 HK97 family phage prohead protease [Sphingobium sp. CR2-8]